MQATTLAMIIDGSHHKGDVFATARIAGIQGGQTHLELIPLCHPLMLSKVKSICRRSRNITGCALNRSADSPGKPASRWKH